MMLFATMLLVFQLVVSDGLLQDQGRNAQVAQFQSQKTQVAGPAVRSGRGQRARLPATDGEVRVFRLEYARCHELASLVRKVLNEDRITSHVDTNSVIFVGSKEQAEKVEDLLAILDIPTDDARPAANLSIVSVSHRDVRSLANEIHTALDRGLGAGWYLSVAADQARSKILLDGEPDAVLKAKSIIEELDTPPATARLEFSFFKARLHGDLADPKIPEDLQPVAAELRRFGQLELLGRLSTIATEQEEFQVEGMIGDMISVEVGGVLLSMGEDDSVKIKLDTGMRLYLQGQAPQRKAPRPHFSLKTVVQAHRGEFIVLGSAPNGWESGESAILVLHVPR